MTDLYLRLAIVGVLLLVAVIASALTTPGAAEQMQDTFEERME